MEAMVNNYVCALDSGHSGGKEAKNTDYKIIGAKVP